MKYLYLLISSALILISLPSCDQTLNPKGEYTEKYVLNCVLRGDTSYQVAVLSHSYNVIGFDPYANTKDPAITGADIRLWYNDSVFVFRDTVVERIGEARYNDSLRVYYLNNVNLLFDKPVEIEALLPNGRRLRSSTTTAKEIIFDNQNSSKVIPPVNTSLVQVSWNGQSDAAYFLPRFNVTWYKKVNGQSERHVMEIPVGYDVQGEQYTPVYPRPSFQNAVFYDPEVVKLALESISGGDPDKSNYSVLINNQISVFGLDQNLGRYYSANLQENDFTVRLDETDYSNIDGGFGVFGSYSIKKYDIRFTPEFLTELGYNPVY